MSLFLSNVHKIAFWLLKTGGTRCVTLQLRSFSIVEVASVCLHGTRLKSLLYCIETWQGSGLSSIAVVSISVLQLTASMDHSYFSVLFICHLWQEGWWFWHWKIELTDNCRMNVVQFLVLTNNWAVQHQRADGLFQHRPKVCLFCNQHICHLKFTNQAFVM